MFGFQKKEFPEIIHKQNENNFRHIKRVCSAVNRTPLLFAASSLSPTRIESMIFLLNSGANPNQVIKTRYDKEHFIFTLCAEENFLMMSLEEQKEIFNVLIEYGAEINNDLFLQMSLEILNSLDERNQKKLVDLFVSSGFNLYQEDKNGLSIIVSQYTRDYRLTKAFEKYLRQKDIDEILYHIKPGSFSMKTFLDFRKFLFLEDIIDILYRHIVSGYHIDAVFYLSFLPREIVDDVIEDIIIKCITENFHKEWSSPEAFICCTAFLSDGVAMRKKYFLEGTISNFFTGCDLYAQEDAWCIQETIQEQIFV